MTARRLLLVALIALVPAHASAQLDDLLAPLAPAPEQPQKVKKKRVRKSKRAPKRDSGTDDLLAPLVPTKGDLVVKVAGVDDAQVTVDGKEVAAGATIALDPGEHTVVVKRPGYADFSRKVKVTGGQATTVTATLDAVAGVLDVTSDVPGSVVLLDGKSLGEAPVEDALVPPGMHEIIVRREGFEDHVSRLSIRAGRDYTVRGALKPKEGVRTLVASNADRPEQTQLLPSSDAVEGADLAITSPGRVESDAWYQRWYVWAGVGAVAAAAVGSAVVVNNNAANRRLSPEEVCDLDPGDGRPGVCDDVMNLPSALLQLGAQIRF